MSLGRVAVMGLDCNLRTVWFMVTIKGQRCSQLVSFLAAFALQSPQAGSMFPLLSPSGSLARELGVATLRWSVMPLRKSRQEPKPSHR
eukprot:5617973-Amphidinium_carterae.2